MPAKSVGPKMTFSKLKQERNDYRHKVNEARLVIKNLTKACDQLMGEYVSKTAPCHWGFVNDALVEARKF